MLTVNVALNMRTDHKARFHLAQSSNALGIYFTSHSFRKRVTFPAECEDLCDLRGFAGTGS